MSKMYMMTDAQLEKLVPRLEINRHPVTRTENEIVIKDGETIILHAKKCTKDWHVTLTETRGVQWQWYPAEVWDAPGAEAQT